MKGFTAYRYYMAIKLHFTTPTYNLFEHNGHVKASLKAFQKRNDRYIFEKLMTRFKTDREVVEYLASNFMYGNNDVIYDAELAEENYTRYLRNKQSLYRIVEDDFSKLVLHAETEKIEYPWADIVYGVKEEHPVLFRMLLSKNVELETCVILNHFERFMSSWKNNLGFLFSEQLLRVEKAEKFIKFDTQRYSELYLNLKKELC